MTSDGFRWCWHKWSRWEEATGVLNPGQIKVAVQIRRCGKCNKTVVRRVYDDG